MPDVPNNPNVTTGENGVSSRPPPMWRERPFLLGLACSALFFACFAWLAFSVIYLDAWDELDTHVAQAMRQVSEPGSTLRAVLVGMTMLGGIRAMVVLALVSALWQARQKRRWLSIGIILLAAGGGLFDLGLKELFDRDRPPEDWRDFFVKETNESFPSGHAMGSTVGYGLLAYALLLQSWQKRWKIAAVAGVAALVLLIGLSRVYLRAHWTTDVLGGYLVGAGWLAWGLGLLETMRRRRLSVTDPRGSG